MAKSWSEDHNNNFDKLEFTLYMYEVAVKKVTAFQQNCFRNDENKISASELKKNNNFALIDT